MPETWDAVIVNDELDLLETRLRVLDEVVDHFIVVEADRTFTGSSKPFHVTDNLSRFARWDDRMTVVRAALSAEPAQWIQDIPDAAARASHAAWAREHEQEHAQLGALAPAAPDDLVLLGDVDEIPYPETLRWILRHRSEPIRIRLRQAVFRANWELPIPWSDGPFAVRARDLSTHPQARVMTGEPSPDMRGYREDELDDGGWHLTSLGGVEDVKRKLGAFSHTELDVDHVSGWERLQLAERLRVEFRGRSRLITRSREDMDIVQRTLLSLRPDLFDFSAPPGTRRAKGVSFALAAAHAGRSSQLDRLLTKGRLPLALALPLSVLEDARALRRRFVPDAYAFRRGSLIQRGAGA